MNFQSETQRVIMALHFCFLLTHHYILQSPALWVFVLTSLSIYIQYLSSRCTYLLQPWKVWSFFAIFSQFNASNLSQRNSWVEIHFGVCVCQLRVLLGVCRNGAVVAVCIWPHHAIRSNDAQTSIKVGTPRGSWGPLGSGTVALVWFFFPFTAWGSAQ